MWSTLLFSYFSPEPVISSVLVSKTFSPFSALFMALIGGFFYLYGMMTGVQIGPYDISIQMLGPVIAGLVAGTISGLLAGSLESCYISTRRTHPANYSHHNISLGNNGRVVLVPAQR